MKPEREGAHTPELEALLAAARRPGVVDPAAEERALRAFRVARDEGVGAAPVRWRRRRDDWRPAAERRRVRALKALVAGVAVAATLGGVAVAAGMGVIPSPFGGEAEPKPVRSAPTAPVVEEGRGGAGRGEGTPQSPVRPTRPSTGDASPGRPGKAQGQDTAAHCRRYLAAAAGRGTAPKGAAMAELEAAAGGPAAVRAYCERLLAAERHKVPQKPQKPHKPGNGKPADGKPADGEPGPGAGKPADEKKPAQKKPQKPADGAAVGLGGAGGAGGVPAALPG
ncbi:hypothetical protein ACFO9E_02255 [Streptomyces maoxianensis]|uniref:Uncharacterized protein n=1 Tax=Streptomyces maoxianensis TaxID=1459942 RepID=A0ABV9G1X9_9ACTN